MMQILACLLRCRRGVSLLEFALIAPVAALLVMGGLDLASAIQQSQRLEAAAQAGAQFAFSRPTDSAGIVAAIRANLPGWTNISVPAPSLTCRCDNGTAVSCNGGVCGSSAPAMYLSVRVSRPFAASTPLVSAFIPSRDLQGHVELRLR
jgi:Flp pilus assembly protein TadG